MRVEAQQKGLAFILDAPPDLPTLVQADGKRIRQILLNLLGNAIKFTDAGRVTLGVQAVPVDSGSIRLQVSVEDTGMGIAPEDHASLELQEPAHVIGKSHRHLRIVRSPTG